MNSLLIVGRDDCPVLKVHSILRFSTSFHLFRYKWSDVARDLDIPEDKTGDIKQELLLSKMGLSDALKKIIDLWVAGKGNTASLEELVQSLERNGLIDCAQRLRTEFKFYADKTKKYVFIPKALKDLLESSDFPSGFIILKTLDVAITMEKIRENLPNCEIFPNYELLLNFLCAGNKWSIIVVTDNDPNTLPNLLENMSGNKPFDQIGKIIFVIDKEEENAKELFAKHRISPAYAKVISDVMEWNDLNIQAKYKVRKRAESYVGFRIENESLESALSGQTLVDLINNRNELYLIKPGLPDKVSYYIMRNLLTRNIISKDAFSEHSDEDIFVFQGISRFELSSMISGKLTANSSEQLQNVTSKFIALDQPHHFIKICQLSNHPIHLLRKEGDGKWSWIKSKGSICKIQEHVSKREDQNKASEDNLLKKLNERSCEENIPVCISDSPGMGKSLLLAQIGRKLQENFPERIVAFVLLPELIKQIRKRNMSELKSGVKLTLAKLVGENYLGELFVESKLNADDNKIWIELLLDGFDEVDYSDSHLSHEILKAISSFKSVRLWVTSRPHLLEELETTLNVLGYNMQPFSEENQIHFLTQFWGERFLMPKESFDNFASACLQVLKKSIDSSDKDIAGIPLQCLMIAEIFQDEAKANAGCHVVMNE